MPNLDHLLEQEVSAPMATRMEQCPEGEYPARIENFELGEAKWNDKQTGEEKTVPTLRLTWTILDQSVKAQLGLENIRVQQDLFLDLDPATGGLSFDKNKNVQLGRIRAALGQNEPGRPWRLPMLKEGGIALVRVTHRPDKNSPEDKYARVTGVARAGA